MDISMPTKGAFPPVPPLRPPGPAHGHLAQLIFSRFALQYAGSDDKWFDGWSDNPSDPFTEESPLFAMLVPHLQVKLLSDIARWVLCGGSPETLSVGHCAALWAARDAFKGRLDIEGDESPYDEAPQPPEPTDTGPAQKGLSLSDGVAYMQASGQLYDLKRSAALVLAEGGNLEAHGLADLPPELPLPEEYLRRQSQSSQQAAVPRGILGLVASPFNPRPACQPSLLAPWNLHRHAVVSAYEEYVTAVMGGGRGGRVRLSVNADTCTTRDLHHMLTTCVKCILGDAGKGVEEREQLLGYCELSQVPRLRRLQALASQLNSAFVAALAHDPTLLSTSFTQLMVLSVHGSYHTQHGGAPEAMREGCEAYTRRLDAWAAVDAGRGIDTRKAYSHHLPGHHQLSVDSMEKEGQGRRGHLLLVAQRAAEAAAEGGQERPLHQCMAEHYRALEATAAAEAEAAAAAVATGSGTGSTGSSASASPNEVVSSTGGEGGHTTLSEHDILNALVVESCVGVLGKVYRAGECGRSGDECCPDTLKRLRFERMLGEYHALMREEAMAGAGAGAGAGLSPEPAALERVYNSLDTRLAVAARIPHPMAPAWLELYPPQGWVKQRREEVQDAGLRCNACNEKKSAQELLACSACKVARYCGLPCQRKHWGSEHKAVCAALRKGRGS